MHEPPTSAALKYSGLKYSGLVAVARAGADLIIPVTCGGCDIPGTPWCARCATHLADAPQPLTPRVVVGVPIWALGRYRGPYRRSIIALKERGRRDLAQPLGAAVAHALIELARWGEIPDAPRLVLIPAPTRRLAARRRGGDPVTAIAEHARMNLGGRVEVAAILMVRSGGRDSAGLDARQRSRNLRGRVVIRHQGSPVHPTSATVLIDDVLTTGATAAESVRVLAEHDVRVDLILVVAGA
ncbi:MAG: ComF family protein [Gordonia sp. (in: high G+C Gram-positive bacteria)]